MYKHKYKKYARRLLGGNQQAGSPTVDESDPSLKKLDEFRDQLQELQKEKSDRLHKVMELVSTLHDLCAVLGLDFYTTVTEVHPSLNDATGIKNTLIRSKLQYLLRNLSEQAIKTISCEISEGSDMGTMAEEESNDGEKSKGASYLESMTPAERRYMGQRHKIDMQKMAKTSNKSHRDRLSEFNQ